MVTFLILMKIGKVEGALEFALKSKKLVNEIYRKEVNGNADLDDVSSPTTPTRQQQPSGEEVANQQSSGCHWDDVAIAALLCSDSDVEIVEDD